MESLLAFLINLDTSLFFTIYGKSGTMPLLDTIGIFFALYAPYLLVLFLFFWILAHRQVKRKVEALGCIALIVFIPHLARLMAQFVVMRPRPFIAFPYIVPLISIPLSWYSFSFPSGHATFVSALAGAAFLIHKRLGYIYGITALFISLARVFVGVHFPSDVIAGSLLGSMGAFATYKLFIQRSGKTILNARGSKSYSTS